MDFSGILVGMLNIGDKMPAFRLADQDGKIVDAKDFKAKKVLIYFYPKDDTPGCTTEACGFRDIRYELQEKGVDVIGISKDTSKSHKKFEEKYQLNFRLLSDESTEVIQKFGAWQEKTLRVSYLFGKSGKVEKVYGKVETKTHAKDVLQDLIKK